MGELISVIVNVYNREKYIKKCLDSIINQTYRNLEILIVNDGSTDNTLEICKSYKDERIKIINQKHIGITLSRNVGIENACGEYLYFIDSDDFIELDTIEYLYNLCVTYKTKFATCRSIDINDYNEKIKKSKEKVKIISNKEMLEKILLWDNRAEAIWNKLIKKELFDNLRLEDRIITDIAFTYKLALRTNAIAYGYKIKYYYLKHNNSISIQGKEDLERTKDLFHVIFERYENIKKIYPKFYINQIGVCFVIARLYLRKSQGIIDFLDSNKAYVLYKELFTIKVLFCKYLKMKEKIKLVLFRINPKSYIWSINFYLKTKRKEK